MCTGATAAGCAAGQRAGQPDRCCHRATALRAATQWHKVVLVDPRNIQIAPRATRLALRDNITIANPTHIHADYANTRGEVVHAPKLIVGAKQINNVTPVEPEIQVVQRNDSCRSGRVPALQSSPYGTHVAYQLQALSERVDEAVAAIAVRFAKDEPAVINIDFHSPPVPPIHTPLRPLHEGVIACDGHSYLIHVRHCISPSGIWVVCSGCCKVRAPETIVA